MAKKSQQKIDRLRQTNRKSQITSTKNQPKNYKSTASQSARRQADAHQRKISKPTNGKPKGRTKTPSIASKCSSKTTTTIKQKQCSSAKDNRLTKALSEVRIRKSQVNPKLQSKTNQTPPKSPSLLGHSIVDAYTSVDYRSNLDSSTIPDSCSNDTCIEIESIDEPMLTNVEITDASVQCTTIMCDAATNTEYDMQTLESIITRFGARLRPISHSEVGSPDNAILSDVSDTTELQELDDSDVSLSDLFNDESDGISEISASPPQQKM